MKGNCQGNRAPKETSSKAEMEIKLLARKQEIEGRKEAAGPRSSGIIQQQQYEFSSREPFLTTTTTTTTVAVVFPSPQQAAFWAPRTSWTTC